MDHCPPEGKKGAHAHRTLVSCLDSVGHLRSYCLDPVRRNSLRREPANDLRSSCQREALRSTSAEAHHFVLIGSMSELCDRLQGLA